MAHNRSRIDEAYQQVPSIGEGRRWYDYPYKIFSGILRSGVGGRLPYRVRQLFTYALNYLHPFNDHERNFIWSREDRMHNVLVPTTEEVEVPGVWAIELFPPSEFDELVKALDRNSWDAHRVRYGFGDRNRDYLERSRSGRGSGWWRLGHLASGPGFHHPDAKIVPLPAAFRSVELTGVHIGEGLTAVVAFFATSSEGASSLNVEWHKSHDPQLVWRRGRPFAEDRQWSAFRAVQHSRNGLHNQARTWMRDVLPGAFARRKVANPLVDLILFSEHDPTLGERDNIEFSGALRALGLKCGFPYDFKSDALPGLLLDLVDEGLCPVLKPETWALWGQKGKVASMLGDLRTYGGDESPAIAHRINDSVRETLRLLSISAFLKEMRGEFADLRDAARIQHGKITRKRLRRMRDIFLSLSIDVSSTVRDVREFHSRVGRVSELPIFVVEEPAWLRRTRESGAAAEDPENYNGIIMERQREWAENLSKEDREYREILSTVASLGASIDTFKVGRIALWVSFMSLVVSLVALLLAEVKSGTVLSHLWRFIET
ncbi:hypothetical protein [Streptomyces sp. NPDC001502]|uniref:hypothetical protein n=1 Tax=Streptomyces sp. NPDC001502 TaxID=3364578 RepID=UPI0036AED8A9